MQDKHVAVPLDFETLPTAADGAGPAERLLKARMTSAEVTLVELLAQLLAFPRASANPHRRWDEQRRASRIPSRLADGEYHAEKRRGVAGRMMEQ